MEIANLVISILSLIATIAISFVIYFLEQHNQKVSKEKEVKQEAKRFIIDNANELDYLHWATIAVGCYPQNKHVRKIYNNFAFLDDEVKQEVLKQRELNCELINNDKWIYKKIDMIQNAIQENIYEIITPSGRSVLPPKGYSWRLNKTRFNEYVNDNRIWFGPDGNNVPSIKRFLSEVKDGVVSMTWWPREEIGDNQEAKREIKALGLSDKPFDTPKPERLIQRILTIATNEGDIVLDSFLGSGTTAAVAHKMKRRWIGIEMENTAYTYCKNRLDMIINGTETGGITKSIGWKSGGGYDFYELAPTLINEDLLGEPIINKEYNPDMLAAAVALHEGFKYCPNSNVFWKQSVSTENSYLFVTTAHLSDLLVKEIEKQMSEDEFLLIACKSFDKSAINISDKIKIKKIPQMLLGKCEFGKDDYSLNIINPPVYEYEEDDCDE